MYRFDISRTLLRSATYAVLLPPPRNVNLCFRRCLSVCLSVRLLATLRKNVRTDLYESFREGLQWANEQLIKFWSYYFDYLLLLGRIAVLRT